MENGFWSFQNPLADVWARSSGKIQYFKWGQWHVDGWTLFLTLLSWKVQTETLLLLSLKAACFLARSRSDGYPQWYVYPRALALWLPAAGFGRLSHVLAARGPEHVPRGGGPGEHHPREVRLQSQEHPQPLRGGLLPPAHREHLRAEGQRQRQVGDPRGLRCDEFIGQCGKAALWGERRRDTWDSLFSSVPTYNIP